MNDGTNCWTPGYGWSYPYGYPYDKDEETVTEETVFEYDDAGRVKKETKTRTVVKRSAARGWHQWPVQRWNEVTYAGSTTKTPYTLYN